MVKLLKEDRQNLNLKLEDLVQLRDTGISGADLAQRPLNTEQLENLTLSDSTTWPPIDVSKTNIGYVIVDGYHRLAAAKEKGLSSLEASCKTYKTENDLIEAVFRVNLAHGLPASKESRSKYAYWLHVAYPDLEQKDIAKRAGISQPAVSTAIARWEAREQKETAQAQGEPIEVSVDEAYSAVYKTFKSFERSTAKIFHTLGKVDDQELVQRIRETIETDEDREHLEHLGRLLLESAKRVKRPRAARVVEASRA